MVGVDSNTHSLVVSASCVPSVPSSVTVSLSVTDAAGMLEVTIHDLAASTEKSNTALMSGWSNTAYTRRASGTSNWEYR